MHWASEPFTAGVCGCEEVFALGWRLENKFRLTRTACEKGRCMFARLLAAAPEAKGRGVRRSTLPYLSRWILEATCLKISVSQRGKGE